MNVSREIRGNMEQVLLCRNLAVDVLHSLTVLIYCIYERCEILVFRVPVETRSHYYQ